MTILAVSPDAPAYVRYAADTILYLHIGGGTVGMLSGSVAVFARKGGPLHRAAGTVFFYAMLTMATIGAAVSPFLPVPERVNVIAGLLTLYLVVTAWMTVRRKDGGVGRFEIGAFIFVATVTAAAILLAVKAANSPGGSLDGSPAPAFYIFAFIGSIAALFDLKVILRGGIAGSARIARHLWRMCFGLFVASGSFFLGQQKMMPLFMQGSPLLFIPALAPLVLMIFWLIRVRLTGRSRKAVAT